ncbi:testis-specific serine/threonine-protein kinase 5-like isoform X1 [Lepisosteus oculatus]|uniref:testis-specific serine/threonine-protein kinase 5-like isoform X1 n=1 Tax=Lepisosteus oculatus TaxID=7918 RepID=UPI0035F522CB
MSGSKTKEVRKSLQEKAVECQENGYLLTAKKIGTGAFSKVYLGYATPDKICQNYRLAKDLRSKNHSMVAIKIISIHEAPPEYSRKFLPREIYALNATYKHPSVIQLYDMFRSPKRVYLVLELASQGDLLEHVNAVSRAKGSPGLNEEEARGLFKQIVSAVTHCHRNHIVHRDLKCENILLDAQGYVKLTDFGFANNYTDKSVLMNTFCGSVAYTAPEILLAQTYNGEQADLWSLGVILYAMVTGKLPYHERHPRKLVQLMRKDLPFNQPVSPGCQDLIRKLLQWKPSARLGLSQICIHHWMAPARSSVFHTLRTSRSDITDKNRVQEKKGVVTSTARSSPYRQSAPVIPDRHLKQGGHRYTACSEQGGKRPQEQDKKKEVWDTPRKAGVPQSRLSLRSAHQSPNPNRLFISRPRLPSSPKPFCNLPNFHKPGSAGPHTQRQQHSLSHGSPEPPVSLRQSRKIAAHF